MRGNAVNDLSNRIYGQIRVRRPIAIPKGLHKSLTALDDRMTAWCRLCVDLRLVKLEAQFGPFS